LAEGAKVGSNNQNTSFDGNHLIDGWNIQIAGDDYIEVLLMRREGIKT
jgi:hypothetical protein